MKRLWIWVLGGVVAFAAAGIALGAVLISRLDVKPLIEQAVYEQTGRKLTIAGSVQPAFFPTLGVHAKDVTLANAPGGEAPALLAADEIQIGVTARALLNRELDITRLVFVHPQLSLEVDAAGKPNWILTPIKAPAPSSPDASKEAQVKEVRLKGAEIERGVVSYANLKTGARYGINDIDARISLPSLKGPLGLDGSLVYANEKTEIALKVATPMALLSGGTSRLAYSMTAAPVIAKFDGQFDAKTGALAGLFEASGPSLRNLLAWIGAPIGAGPGLETFAVNGRMLLAANAASFENASFKLDAVDARGDFLVETGRAKPYVSGRLEVMALDLNPYLAAPPPAAGAAPVARIESVDVAAPQGWSRTPIDLGGLKAINANLDLTTGPLTALKMKLDRAKVDLVLNDGYLAATLSELSMYGGSGRGRLEIDARAPEIVVRQELNVVGVDSNRFLTDAAGFRNLEGVSSVRLKLESRGATQHDLMSTLSGTMGIALAEGALRGVNLAGVSRTIRTAIEGGMVGPTARTPFKTFNTSFVVADGVMATDDLAIRAADAEITAAGIIDLGQRTMDMRIRPKSESVLSRLGIAPGAGIATPFRVSGQWAKLTYKIDLLGGARDMIAQQVQNVRKRAQMSRQATK